jgi:hypothetical protein
MGGPVGPPIRMQVRPRLRIASHPSTRYTGLNSASWSLTRRWSREAGLQQYRRHNSRPRFARER